MPLEQATGSGISIVSSDNSNGGNSSPMDISLSSLSSHSSSSYHIVSPPKKTVRFADQNCVWLRSVNDDDLRAAWYTDDDYKAFEADNRHIVSTLLQQRKERETSNSNSNAVNANSKPPSIPLLDDCVVEDADANDHDHCICGLEHYMEGRKPMMKRKLCILQHSAMVLEMFEEQRRTTTTNSTSSTSSNNNATTVALSTAASVLDGTSNHSHGSNHTKSTTTSTDRLWLDPELVRKVSLRFSKEPTQRALNRAAQMAASL
jgi:hypothetical protein